MFSRVGSLCHKTVPLSKEKNPQHSNIISSNINKHTASQYNSLKLQIKVMLKYNFLISRLNMLLN